MKLLGTISLDFDITDKLPIRFCALARYWRRNGSTMRPVHELFIDLKKTYDSVKREVLYIILVEFEVPMKLVRLIETCSNETYSKVHPGKYFSNNFPVQNGLKQDVLLKLLSTLLYIMPV
jgi:hypothetical protein